LDNKTTKGKRQEKKGEQLWVEIGEEEEGEFKNE